MKAMIKSGLWRSSKMLLKTHLGMWLGLLVILTVVILLLSNFLIFEQRIVAAELASTGLQANAKLINNDKPMTVSKAIEIATTLSRNYQAVTVPLNYKKQVKCHFATFTEYTTEKWQIIDGFEQLIKTKQNAWVANGAFDISLSRSPLAINRPKFKLVNQSETLLGEFELIVFTENAVKLALGEPLPQTIQDGENYYFTFESVADKKLGPAFYDTSSGYFFLTDHEQEITAADLLDNNPMNDFIDALFTRHMPFVEGVAVEQLQLGEYQNSFKLTQHNNKLMLTACLNKTENHNEIKVPSMAFLSEPLFRKLFVDDFDFKVLKIECFNEDNTQFEHIFSVQGHYDFIAKQNQNPNQIFMTLPKVASSVSHFNGFLIKDLGDMNKVVSAIKNEVFDGDVKRYWHVEYLEQLLKSKHILKLLQGIYMIVAVAILLSLIMPLMKIMRHELFLIKLYDGSVMLSLASCAFTLYTLAIIFSYLLSVLFNDYFNNHILAPFNVPLVRLNEQFLYQAILLVGLLWVGVWVNQIYNYQKRQKQRNLL